MTRLTSSCPPGVVRNLHCEACVDGDRLTLLYRVRDGVCGKSYGLDVANLVGFPKHVLEDAAAYLKEAEGEACAFDASRLEEMSKCIEEFKRPEKRAAAGDVAREIVKKLKCS